LSINGPIKEEFSDLICLNCSEKRGIWIFGPTKVCAKINASGRSFSSASLPRPERSVV